MNSTDRLNKLLVAAFKRPQAFSWLSSIAVAYSADPDLTPLTVKRLCQELFGRTGSQWLIVEVFGDEKRQHRSADSNAEAVQKLAARCALSWPVHSSNHTANTPPD
ncbi:hypothetical protein ACYOCY_004853 [Escherichia coli]|uniref:hypothetical protein n=1 Tax=Escherichia coli TaxID=562 RepID=UPI003D7FB92F